jgi:hypothetical protein
MNKRRMRTLIAFLQDVPRKEFTMEFWWKDVKKNGHTCGTAGCAAGWAAHIPSFKRAGYKLDACWQEPQFKGKVEFEAIAELLDIPVIDASFLFGCQSHKPNFHNTPKRVAKNLERYMNGATVKELDLRRYGDVPYDAYMAERKRLGYDDATA